MNYARGDGKNKTSGTMRGTHSHRWSAELSSTSISIHCCTADPISAVNWPQVEDILDRSSRHHRADITRQGQQTLHTFKPETGNPELSTSTQQVLSRPLNQEPFVRSSEILVSNINLFLCDWSRQWWVSHIGVWMINISKKAIFHRFCKSPRNGRGCC